MYICACVCAYILEVYLSFRQTQFLLAQESQEPSHFSPEMGTKFSSSQGHDMLGIGDLWARDL